MGTHMAKKSPVPPAAKPIENAPPPSAEPSLFPIVGIGASAGGLSAFTKLLKALPTDTGMGFVLVQHLDPTHISLLPELMARATTMSVVEVSDGMPIKPNHVYVMPPNHSLGLLHGVLHLMPRPDIRGKHLPIDDFLHSLAQDQQSNAIGIILSGTASDGTQGMQAIKAVGGITFAQTEESSEYSGMPHSVIAAGHVDFILTPEQIAQELERIARHPYMRHKSPDSHEEALIEGNIGGNKDTNKIFVLLRTHTGVDFSLYKQNTIRRRIKRRMLLHQLDRLRDYVKFLQAQPKELDALFQDMLISVTNFFRDPETFDALKHGVFPRLMLDRPMELPIRIWVPACSTGEEVYSVAIALFEFLGDSANLNHLQIFASDVNRQAIDKARQGIYPQSIQEDMGIQRLQRFFIRTATGYQICKSIRDVCVFAVQDVTRDPPFSRLDLICCRNLMIYLGPVLQKKVLHTFHYALRANGCLMLGTSESIGNETDFFSIMDRKNKIYIRRPTQGRPGADFDVTSRAVPFPIEHPSQKSLSPFIRIQHEAENLILEKYGPPGVIINQDMEILHFRGQTGLYINPSAGSASLNLLKMARHDLVLELRVVVQQAIKERGMVRKEKIRILEGSGYRNINLQVIPLPATETALPNYLVLFELGSEIVADRQTEQQSTAEINDIKDVRIKELEDDLRADREYMQSIIENQEGSNEELQSANEEIQSANEELQSTNEELETAKEELQSTNEELATIIEEHESRNRELNVANSDLANLLASIDLAIVILRGDLHIRRFTPAAKLLLNLIDADVGRPISNIRSNIDIPELEQRVLQVIETMIPQEVELQDRNGRWYILRLRPYRTLDNRIEGAVMTLVDIDSVKETERLRQVLQREQYLAAVVRDASDAVMLQDFGNCIIAWNQRAVELYGYSEEEALQLNAAELTPDEAREDMHTLLERLRRGEKVLSYETLRRAKNGRVFKVSLTISVLLDQVGNPSSVAFTEREVA